MADSRYGTSTVRNLGRGVRTCDLFEHLHSLPMAVFLDSSRQGPTGRFSIIGIDPYLVIEETDGVCTRYGAGHGEAAADTAGTTTPEDIAGSDAGTSPAAPGQAGNSFEEELRRELDRIRCTNPTELPLLDGAIGYLAYDYGRKFEGISSRHPRTARYPDARMVFYDTLVVEDHLTGETSAIAHGRLRDPSETLDRIGKLASRAQPASIPSKGNRLAEATPNFGKEEYKGTLAKMIRYIIDGDIYIANMTQQLEVKGPADPYDVYRYMRVHNPAPFSAYLGYPDAQMACASMERFLQVRDGRVETRPIKGTRPRGRDAGEDAAMRLELERSSKDRSELLMIVDLERNDLNYVCKPGTVQVTEHFAVEEYATVFHLVSTIIGELDDGTDAIDLIEAAFPGGSITGAPKIRAMEIIDELEHGRRGIYTGSIGYLAADGNCDFNIVIRTAVHQAGMYGIGVGGGITCESDLEFEYGETLQKAKAVLEAIAAAQDLQANRVRPPGNT